MFNAAARCPLVWMSVPVMVAVVLGAGCSRDRYYQAANQEAYCLVAEKSDDPRWAAPDFTIDVDPRSRYFDPCNPICPPMPQDDPAAHRYMHCVDGKKGWPCWHTFGQRGALENPTWRERLPDYVTVTPQGAIELNADSAMRLAYVNSPSYQSQLETLYLSALDVSSERFNFDIRFFGGNDTSFAHLGRLRSGAGETNTLRTDTDLLLRRQFATAGELLVGFANSFVWQFAGPDTYATSSLINFSLVQPLLRGAGRDVALEQLTIAERTLLSNLRALQRYRQGFYTNIVIGQSGVSGPQRRGGFFGGTGLTGFTGTGSGGFGGVGSATGFGRAGFGGGTGGGTGGGGTTGFAGGGAGQVGGLVGLLQQLQQIHNTEESLNAQVRALSLLEAHLQAGTIDLTQVDQFRQSVETERANLLQSINSLESSLDSYKTGTLGLPPDLLLALDDRMIRQFQFIEPGMSELQNEIADFLEAFGERPAEPEVAAIQASLARVAQLRSDGGRQFAAVEEDLGRLGNSIGLRQKTMTPEQARQLVQEQQRLAESLAGLQQRFDQTAGRLQQLEDQLTPETRRQTADKTVELVTELSVVIDELSLVQARARVESVAVEPESISPELALDVARVCRLDWMNNRAALVDTWRLIAFNADALQSDLDIVFSGDMSTTGNNPVKFRAPTGNLQVGLQFDGPFTRLLERNNFRQVLIDYQRDRRQLIQYEDGIHQGLRSLIREMEYLETNLEIQRRAVAIAIRRVDQTREVLNEPPPPVQPGEPASQLGPTAALNLMTALSDLRSSQNNFMSVWLNYYSTRMQLMRELGLMEIDEHGMWIDQPLSEYLAERPEGVPTPPAVPGELIQAVEAAPANGKSGTRPGATDPPMPPTRPVYLQQAAWSQNAAGQRH